jgi:cell division protein FtsL
LLALIAVIGVLYISGGIAAFQAWRQNSTVQSSLAQLEREHSRLVGEHARLGSRSTIEAEALRMGMTHPGEQQYLVTGLPAN